MNSTRTPPTSHLRSVLLVAALPTMGACFGGLGRTGDPFHPDDPNGGTGRVTIEVQNLNFNDATVYAIRNGQEIRIGQVTGKTDETFRIEWSFAHPMQFLADLVGGRRCRTTSVLVDPGDRLSVQIPSNIGMTPCMVNKR